jgi:hypothetical protein
MVAVGTGWSLGPGVQCQDKLESGTQLGWRWGLPCAQLYVFLALISIEFNGELYNTVPDPTFWMDVATSLSSLNTFTEYLGKRQQHTEVMNRLDSNSLDSKMAQVVQHLPRKHEDLSSNPSTTKKKKKSSNPTCLIYWGGGGWGGN